MVVQLTIECDIYEKKLYHLLDWLIQYSNLYLQKLINFLFLISLHVKKKEMFQNIGF